VASCFLRQVNRKPIAGRQGSINPGRSSQREEPSHTNITLFHLFKKKTKTYKHNTIKKHKKLAIVVMTGCIWSEPKGSLQEAAIEDPDSRLLFSDPNDRQLQPSLGNSPVS
jgi:hypothetical protein